MPTLPMMLDDRASADPRPVPGVTGRFPAGPRSVWGAVPDSQWNDWHWQQRERITHLHQLEKVIRVTDDERRAAIETEKDFHMGRVGDILAPRRPPPPAHHF